MIKSELMAISADLKLCGEAFVRMADALETMFKTKETGKPESQPLILISNNTIDKQYEICYT
jgi:hypothetical protein